MIPVKQTRLVTETQRGNCYPAVIASILEMECEEVFQVQELYDSDYWKEPFDDWLLERGFVIKEAEDFRVFHGDLWERRYIDTDNEKGNPKDLTKYQWREQKRKELKDQFYFVSGISPRNPNINHITIWQNGLLVHDPHPDNTGITTIDYFSRLANAN